MNSHFKKIIHYTTLILTQARLWYGEQTRLYRFALGIFVVLLILVLGKFIFLGNESTDEAPLVGRKVTLASVSSLSNMEDNFPLIGTVTSVSEATIRSESSGKLTRVYKSLGDTVYAGAIIAEFENSSERASLLQAEGAYEQAKVGRSIATLNSGQSGSSLTDTRNLALNTISSSYGTLDDAIRGKTDSAFTDPKFDQVKLSIAVPDAALSTSLESKRKVIETILKNREQRNRSLSPSSNLIDELTSVQNESQIIKTYLDDLYTAYSKSIPDTAYSQSTLDAGKANVQTARQSVSGLIATLVSTRTALTASITANQVAGGETVEVGGALASANAQVKQALGAYNAALSRLEKTIIRSPITGTLNSLTINTGDYISAFTQVAVVSNNGALEVVSFVNEDDAKRISVGAPVTINATAKGVVTRIASAIDPTTGKIEVRIGINDFKSTLINGQSVSVVINKSKKDVVRNTSQPIIIPLSALKLSPRGANVFEVSASGTLVALPVKEGAILGEQIQILEGLQGSEDIVVDARGLKEGQEVSLEK